MNLKRIFGAILTSLGVMILLYGGYAFLANSGAIVWKSIIVAVVLGTIFFGAGIGLVKGTQDN